MSFSPSPPVSAALLQETLNQIDALLSSEVPTPTERKELEHYRRETIRAGSEIDPVFYAENVLRVRWPPKLQEAARALLRPPYRVLVRSCNGYGKSHWAAGLTSWWFDTFVPSVALTTGPTKEAVQDVLWGEVRTQRHRVGLGGFIGPQAPRMERAHNHWATGFVANSVEAFHGRHHQRMLFVLDEATDKKFNHEVFMALASMFDGEGHAMVCLYNPIDPTSMVKQLEESGLWSVIDLPAFEHPNVLADLAGEPQPFPENNLNLSSVSDKIIEYGASRLADPPDVIGPEHFEWPPLSGRWWVSSPECDARARAQWPSQSVYSVWSEIAFNRCCTAALPDASSFRDTAPEVGLDLAQYGSDYSAIHSRRGPVSVHHDTWQGQSWQVSLERAKAECERLGNRYGWPPKRILVKIDDDSIGGKVVGAGQAEGWNFQPLSAASPAVENEKYPNRRSEMWFAVATRASEGRLYLGLLSKTVQDELRRQAMSPRWSMDSHARRVVEKKDETKKRLRRSPDDMDALNLAYAPASTSSVSVVMGRQAELAAQAIAQRKAEQKPKYQSKPGEF